MTATPTHFAVLDMANFAERLRLLRSERKITQTRLAQLLDVSPRVYNRWETGDAVPHFDTVVKIADALQVSLDELAGREETTSEALLRNPELHELVQQVDQLPDSDQQALIAVMDGLVKRTQIAKMKIPGQRGKRRAASRSTR